MRIVVFLVVLSCCPAMSFAQDVEHAKIDMAQELTRCAGYYLAQSADGNGSSPTEASKALQVNGKQAMKMAETYVSDKSQLGQMGGAAAEAFTFMSVKSGWEKINQSYAEPCKSILKNPENRFQHLLNK